MSCKVPVRGGETGSDRALSAAAEAGALSAALALMVTLLMMSKVTHLAGKSSGQAMLSLMRWTGETSCGPSRFRE